MKVRWDKMTEVIIYENNRIKYYCACGNENSVGYHICQILIDDHQQRREKAEKACDEAFERFKP